MASVTVLVTSSEVTATEPIPVIPAEDNAVSTAPVLAKAPVKVVPVAKVIAVVVLPSSVFNAAAATVVSVILIVYAPAVVVRVARVVISPSDIVAVTTPDV